MKRCPICFNVVPLDRRADCRFDSEACRNEFKALAKRAKYHGWSADDYVFYSKHMVKPLQEIRKARAHGSIGFVCVLHRCEGMPLMRLTLDQITFPQIPFHYRLKFGGGRTGQNHFTFDPLEVPRVPFDYGYQIKYVAAPSVILLNHREVWVELPGTAMTFHGSPCMSDPRVYGTLTDRNR